MMTTEETEILDFEKLLAPIPGDNAVGENLRYDGVYDKITEHREADDPNLPQGVWETDLKTADWKSVKDLCIDALINKSKDLQLSAWLLEALLHLSGFKGVLEGMNLILKLCEKYWDHLYPALEGEDLDFRISPIIWINGSISEKLRTIKITQPEDQDLNSFNFQDWGKIVHLETLAKQSASAKKNLDSERKFTKAVFNKSVASTPYEFLESTSEKIDSILRVMNDLSTLLDEKCGKTSPGLMQFKKSLEDIKNRVKLQKKQKGPVSKESNSSENPQTKALKNNNMSTTLSFDSGHQISNREEAYHSLSEIADYLTEIDPHSPVPFLIKRAVNWGAMTLSELLTELLKDGQNLQQVYSLLGIHE